MRPNRTSSATVFQDASPRQSWYPPPYWICHRTAHPPPRGAIRSLVVSYTFAASPIVLLEIPWKSFCFKRNLVRFFAEWNAPRTTVLHTHYMGVVMVIVAQSGTSYSKWLFIPLVALAHRTSYWLKRCETNIMLLKQDVQFLYTNIDPRFAQ